LEPQKMADKSVALYSLPIKIVEVIMMLWTFFLNSILPLLTENFKQKNFVKYKEIISNSFNVLFAFWVWVLSLWLVFRDYLIKIITWESAYKYLDKSINHYTSSDAFVIVLFVLLFYFISLLFTYILVSAEKQSRLLKINIIVTIINIVWNIIFIPKFSFVWAWIVTVFSQISLLILWYFYTKDIVKINFSKKYILTILVLWFFIFSFWNFLITKFPIWLYLEVLLYWWVLFWIYSFIVFKILHKK
jgi:O-antigen/teichoic acid export membrane protein